MRRLMNLAIALALVVGGVVALPYLRGPSPAKATGSIYPLTPPAGDGGWARPSYEDSGPPLLFVDQEHVPGPGLLARADVSGAVRLFEYDEPGPELPLHFVWVLRNTGTRPVSVTVTDQAAAAPGSRYLPLAASVQSAFLAGSPGQTFEVAPGQMRLLRDRATALATDGQLAFSIYDLELDGSLQVMNVATEHLSALGPATLPSGYPGGGGIGALFPHDTRDVTVRFAGTENRLAIAGHDVQDPAMVARDLVTGARNTDEGNYGMTYDVRIVFPPSPMPSTNLWVTAGGCALRADFLMRSGPLRGTVVQVPAVGSLPQGDIGTALSTLTLSPVEQSVVSFSVLPPAASCTPIGVWEEPVSPTSLAVRLYQIPVCRWLVSL